MVHLLLPGPFHLPFYNCMHGSSGVVIGEYEPFSNCSVCYSQVDDQFAFVAFSSPDEGGEAIISDLQCTSVNHFSPPGSIPLLSESWITWTDVGIEVPCEDSAALPNNCLFVQLLCQSLSRLPSSFIVNTDNPPYYLPSSPQVSSNNIIISTAG